MLQKPEKAVYNRLSRRQMLKVFGVGMGVITVGAMSSCTTKLLEPANEDISAASIPLSKDELLDEFEEYKAIWKELRQIQAGKRASSEKISTLIERARSSGHKIFENLDSKGILRHIKEETLIRVSHQGDLFTEEERGKLRKFLKELAKEWDFQEEKLDLIAQVRINEKQREYIQLWLSKTDLRAFLDNLRESVLRNFALTLSATSAVLQPHMPDPGDISGSGSSVDCGAAAEALLVAAEGTIGGMVSGLCGLIWGVCVGYALGGAISLGVVIYCTVTGKW